MEIGPIFGQELSNKLPKDLLSYGLINFVDSNFIRDPKDYKSVMNYYFFLNRIVISWCSKKQRTLSISITEAEYIALRYVLREAV